MELLILILSSVFVCVCVNYVIRVLTKNDNNELPPAPPLPPGSAGWPMIGETLEYLNTARDGVPEKFIEDRKKKYRTFPDVCKVFKTSLLLEPVAVMCTAAGNKFLFSNENKLVKSWWPYNIDQIFASSEKSSSHEIRRILTKHLKPDSLQKFIGIMDAITKEHLDTYWDNQKDQVVKVHEVAGKYTSTMALRFFFNIEDPQVVAELEEFINLVSAGFISLPINFPGTKFNRALEASRKMRKYVENMLVEERKKRISSPAGDARGGNYDVWSSMLMLTSSVDGQPVKDSDIANKLCGLIIASDNVIATLDSIIMYLSELPHVYDAVLKEQMEIANSKAAGELLNWGDVQKMKYTWCVVCEVLRLKPPVLGTFREAITDFIYEGYLIPKGLKLHWNAFATHKNPEYFPNPEKFDPSRFQGNGPAPFSYVPFGGGVRICPGRVYARFKILVFMHNLVTRYRWEKVFPDEKMIMDPSLVPGKGLPIRLYPHASTQRP